MDKTITIIFTTPIINYPATSGPELRVQNTIKALSKIANVIIVSRLNPNNPINKKAINYYLRLGCKFILVSSSDINKLGYLKYKLSKLTGFLSTLDAEQLIELAKKNNAKIIWFGYGQISYSLIKKVKKICPNAKIVVDTDSVWSRFLQRGIKYEKSYLKKAYILLQVLIQRKRENHLTSLSSVTTAVSEIDAEYYQSLTNDKRKVFLFLNVIDLASYKKILSPPLKYISPCIYLAGTFWKNSPMDRGARWFINNVFPLILQEFPKIHFYIVGKNSKETLKNINHQNITITGEVETVLPYLQHSSMAIVPIFFESGTRFKILEAGACSKPVVSTKLGAEGLKLTNKKHIMIADSPKEFADAIIKVINTPKKSEKMGKALNGVVRQNYSIDSLMKQGINILNSL